MSPNYQGRTERGPWTLPKCDCGTSPALHVGRYTDRRYCCPCWVASESGLRADSGGPCEHGYRVPSPQVRS